MITSAERLTKRPAPAAEHAGTVQLRPVGASGDGAGTVLGLLRDGGGGSLARVSRGQRSAAADRRCRTLGFGKVRSAVTAHSGIGLGFRGFVF